MVGPPHFPYSGLPILRVAESEGQEGFVLSETTAILAFPDEYLQQGACEAVRSIPVISPPQPDSTTQPSLQTRVQMQMIRDASLYSLDRVFQMSPKEVNTDSS